MPPVRQRSKQKTAPAEDSVYRTLFACAPEGQFLMSHVFLDCNEEVCRILGCDRTEILGRSPIDFSPVHQPDGRPSADAAEAYIRAAMRGQPQCFPWQHLRADKTPVETEISLKAIQVGETPMVHAIMRDVTERNAAQQALQSALARLRELEQIVDRSPAIAFLWKAAPGWPVEFVSDNVSRFGYRAEDLISGARSVHRTRASRRPPACCRRSATLHQRGESPLSAAIPHCVSVGRGAMG